MHDAAEALALEPDQVGGGHRHVVKVDVRRVGASPAHLGQRRAADAGPLPLDEDGLPGMIGTQFRLTAQAPNLGLLVAMDFPEGWGDGQRNQVHGNTRG